MVQTTARSGGSAMNFSSAADTQAFYMREATRWAKYVKDSGVKPEQ